ncbi:MAG TPA: N-acyl homoserine lactonase family protein [Solirubrobacteraceae bacterium]|nr:N-acyl homoserine lactonase family protein [Solirubrobacteraceae bacterium]
MGIKVTILDHGDMHCDLTWLVLKSDLTLASRAQRDLPRRWVQSPTHTVLIEHPDARILWDTSCPADWEQRWAIAGNQEYFPYDGASDDQLFFNKLDGLGLAPDAIDVVIMSHLHGDHAGNLRALVDAGAKPYVSRDELDGALAIEGPYEGAHIKSDYEGIDFETFAGDIEFVPGVRILQSPGHSWGTCSLQVDLPKTGTMLFTSDAVYRSENWGPPICGSSIVWDSRVWESSLRRLQKVASRTDAFLLFGHDGDQMNELRRSGQWVFE